MFYSNPKLLIYPLLFTSMVTLSFAMEAPRRAIANYEWFYKVLEASMQRTSACENTDPALQSSSPELQPSSFASAFEPPLYRLAEFQQHCSNLMDKLGRYIPSIHLQSYISIIGQQFNSSFFKALQLIPPAEITTISALTQRYSKFYLIGIISYARKKIAPLSRKAAFPSNLSPNLCIKCPISFRHFLDENQQMISSMFERIIKSLKEEELKAFCTESFYTRQIKEIEKSFYHSLIFENGTAADSPAVPTLPHTTATNKDKPAKRRRTADRQTVHSLTSKATSLERSSALPLLPQYSHPLQTNNQRASAGRSFKEKPEPQTYQSLTWDSPRLSPSKYYSQRRTLPTGDIIFINKNGAVFYGDPLKAKVALPEHLEKVREISKQLFGLWRSTQISLDDFQHAYFSLDTILYLLENNFALCSSQLIKFLRGIENAADNDIEEIFMECQRRRIPAHAYAEQIYNTLNVAYEFALENNMLVDFFTSAFKAQNLPRTTAIALPHESLEDWFKRASAMLEIYDSHPPII